jgi:Fe-S-cluster containining protein
MRPCEACVGQCCKHYAVNLNGHDVWRIASTLRLAPEQFVTIGQESQPTPVGFRLDATKMTFALVLAKRQGPDGIQQCTFLANLGGGISRCGIYPHRPAACRVFPAKLVRGSVAFREDVVCPKGSWNVAALDLSMWRKLLLRSHMEWALYATVVRHWNEAAVVTPRGEMRTPKEFFRFLSDRHATLEKLEGGLSSQEMDEVIARWGQRSQPGAGEAAWERFAGRVDEAFSAI